MEIKLSRQPTQGQSSGVRNSGRKMEGFFELQLKNYNGIENWVKIKQTTCK